MLLTFIFANVVCFASSIIPIFKISKIPIKDVVLNTFDDNKTRNKSKIDFIGFIFIATAFILNYLSRNIISVGLSGFCLVICIIGFIKIIPVVMKVSYTATEFISKTLFGNIGLLAAKNSRCNKSINNSVSLIAIGIAILFFVSTIGYSLGEWLTSSYDDLNYDVNFSADSADINMLKAVKSDPNVKDARGVYIIAGVPVSNLNRSLSVLYSANGVKTLDFMNFLIDGDEKEIIEKLNSGRNIIVGSLAAQNLGVTVGDTIALELKNGDKDYKIVGISEAAINMQNFGMIGDTYFKKDTGETFYYEIDIISTDTEAVVTSLNERFAKQNIKTQTKNEMLIQNKTMVDLIVNMITAFAVLALLIGAVGIVNNLLISFIERKKSLAMLRSIGISKRDMVKMVFIEALLSGAMGGAMGLSGGIFTCVIGHSLLKGIGVPVDFIYNTSTFVVYLWGGIAVTIAATIIPALKASKLNIIESIKFE